MQCLGDAHSSPNYQGTNYYITFPAPLDAIEASLVEVQATRKQIEAVSQLATAEANTQAYEMYVSDFLPLIDVINANILKIADEVNVLAVAQDKTAADTTTMILMLIVGILTVAIVLAIVMGLLIRKSIAVPVKEIKVAMAALTNGELDSASVTYISKDELCGLSENMRSLTARLRSIIHEVSDILGQMGDGNFTVTSRQALSRSCRQPSPKSWDRYRALPSVQGKLMAQSRLL